MHPTVGPARFAPRRPRNGFTLVELIMVVVVIALVAAVALPEVDLTGTRVRSAVSGVGNTLLAAQRQAVIRQHNVVVMFDTAQPALRILDDANNDGETTVGETVRVVPIGEHVVFGRGPAPARPMGSATLVISRLVDGMPAITFGRNGAASEAAGFYLTSRRAVRTGQHPEDSRAVELDRATGRASWYRYTGSAWARVF
jgi:prepilin-type N-terminal cleavage/methylation domain-containing protein